MYKSKLQELCQRRSWEWPEYTTVKDGPDHMAYVKVHGEAFETPEQCKSAKDAQNTVARIAFNHFYVPPPRVTRRLTPTSAPAGVNSVFGAVTVASSLPAVPPAASLPAVSPDVSIARVSPAANPSEMQPVAAVTPVNPVSPPPSSPPISPPGKKYNGLVDKE